MRRRTLFTLALLFAGPAQSYTIFEDRGGPLMAYVHHAAQLAGRQERVVIRQLCASACTYYLVLSRYGLVCAHPNAVFVFHQPIRVDIADHDRGMSDALMAAYPPKIAAWIRAHGGLTSRDLYLYGDEMRSLVPQCWSP